ncbi:MAG: inorganic diphosphatase [Clostridia bacterium]|nr:inorganic diphosphatase [Clostridia bacterium]
MDRPVGYVHEKEKYTLTYPINYGFIPDVIGGDGEELDVYLLGIDKPVSRYTAKIIGIVHRENDTEDKLIAAPEGMFFTKEEIAGQINFQEKHYDSFIETVDSFFECSVKDCFVDRKLPAELEHFLLNKLLCPCEDDVYRFPSWKEYGSLDEFKAYRDMEEHGDITIYRPEFVCNPRTLFTALWRRYLCKKLRLSDKAKINLIFYFRNGNLIMKVESIEE